ncbi:hypothetical protein SLEP1_g13924 [Rubroshorea leprosula]|uniref:Uncharacterized protein n=1 Tax=Rubroshorea leprosula TaxID=152421 RepID=A0AAV5IHH4_9ROSI|nr:hypothetical protein SLEP1_g13924 [Rubroshorea leprosula]
MFNPSHSVKIWLDDIRDLAYDMEDVLDEFVTDARRSNLTAKPHHASTSKLIPSCFNCFKQSDFVSNSQAISKVDDITHNLQRIIDESKTLGLMSWTTQARDGLNKASTRRLPTTSLPEPYVYGRESDKATILQKLLNDEGSSSKGFSVFPIYGTGGVGKTTLAQLVYNEVKLESFELKAWVCVCVSDQIDIPSITGTILEVVGEKFDSNDLNLLQRKLSEVLFNKKFLLVLDDIWNENPSLWDSLQKPFLSGAAGNSIGDLKCLKYLKLSKTLIESLPESVGFLLQLQTLLLFDCDKFLKFPSTIGNLIELHHLNIMGTNSLKEMPTGITNLKNLLTLSKFVVGKANGLMRLSDLKNFQQLQGKLFILDLQNVFDVQDAREANLGNIHGLDELLLEWTYDFSNSRERSNGEMQVLDCLKPHSKLKSLKIVFYGGHKFPSWMGDPLFSNLSYLELKNCERCTLLPSLRLLPVLKSLSIEGMKAIEAVGRGFYGHGTFPSLERLVFRNMFNWKKWASPMGSGGEFPCLHDLVIQRCPKLIGQLPSNLGSLINLVIEACPELRCSSMSLPLLRDLNLEYCNASLLKGMVDLTSLTSLRIWRISELNCMPKSFLESLTMIESPSVGSCEEFTCLWEEGTEIANHACLERMEICHCPLLVCLAGKEQGLLPLNLKNLHLQNCGELELLPNVLMMKIIRDGRLLVGLDLRNLSSLEELAISRTWPPDIVLPSSLTSLEIIDVENLKSISKEILHSLNSLQELHISNCPKLRSLPREDLPPLLGKLYIRNCQHLKQQHFEAKGDYLHLTRSIPCIEIDEDQDLTFSIMKN